MQGLGDGIKVITEALGIEQCNKCKERQQLLNRLFPFKNAKAPTEEDDIFLTTVFKWYKGLPIKKSKIEDIRKCEQIWIRLFNVKTEACKSCSATYQNNYMKDLLKLWESKNL
tara:strand:- start:1264 stop:1602 length:339 start_codon:yes stop_codon:yes gene_type:complete